MYQELSSNQQSKEGIKNLGILTVSNQGINELAGELITPSIYE